MAKRKARRPSTLPSGSSPYDELVSLFTQIVRDEMAASMPRLGTVKGKDGQRVKVQPWGEAAESDESHPRDGGKNARNEDTVLLVPIGGGNFVALGPIIGQKDGGRDEMISGKELENDAIEERHLKNNAIKGRHVQGGSIGKREVGRNFIARDMLDGNFANSLADAQHIGRLDKRINREGSRIDNLMRRMKNQDGQDGP